MVQTAAAMTTVSPSTDDWLQEATLTRNILHKWHKGHGVCIILSLPAQARFGVNSERVKGQACVLLLTHNLVD